MQATRAASERNQAGLDWKQRLAVVLCSYAPRVDSVVGDSECRSERVGSVHCVPKSGLLTGADNLVKT